MISSLSIGSEEDLRRLRRLWSEVSRARWTGAWGMGEGKCCREMPSDGTRPSTGSIEVKTGAEMVVKIELWEVFEVAGWSGTIGVDKGGGASSARTKVAVRPPRSS